METMKQLRQEIEQLKKEVAELKAQPKQEIHYHFPKQEYVPYVPPTYPWLITYRTTTGGNWDTSATTVVDDNTYSTR